MTIQQNGSTMTHTIQKMNVRCIPRMHLNTLEIDFRDLYDDSACDLAPIKDSE